MLNSRRFAEPPSCDAAMLLPQLRLARHPAVSAIAWLRACRHRAPSPLTLGETPLASPLPILQPLELRSGIPGWRWEDQLNKRDTIRESPSKMHLITFKYVKQ